MTNLKRGALLTLTIASLLAGVLMLWFAFGGGLDRDSGVPVLFLVAAVVNAVALLCYLRLIQASQHLTAEQKNLWTIGVFFGLGIAQLVYFARHVRSDE